MSSWNVSKLIPYSLLLYLCMSWMAMAPMNIAEWIFIVLFLIHFFKTKNLNFKKPDLDYYKATLFMSGFFILSIIFYKIFPLQILDQMAQSRMTQALLKQIYFFLPIIIAMGLREVPAPQLKKLGMIAVGVFGVLSLISFQQYWTGFPIKQGIPGVDGRFHAVGFLGHHLSLASIWIFPAFLILDFSRLNTLDKKQKNILLAVAVLSFVVIFLSYSRMAWVATGVGLALYFLFSLKKIKDKMMALGAYGAACAVVFSLPTIQARIHQSNGVFDRLDLWKVHFELFKLRPMTGVGLLESQEYSGIYQIAQGATKDVFSGHAHNVVIEILSSTGLLGLVGFLIWTLLVSKFFYQWRKIPGVLGLGVAWIVFLLNGLTQVNFFEGKVMHQVAWCIAVLLFLGSRGGQNEKAPR